VLVVLAFRQVLQAAQLFVVAVVVVKVLLGVLVAVEQVETEQPIQVAVAVEGLVREAHLLVAQVAKA
jgi:hypothetical protein